MPAKKALHATVSPGTHDLVRPSLPVISQTGSNRQNLGDLYRPCYKKYACDRRL
jgi:hypothetical protein